MAEVGKLDYKKIKLKAGLEIHQQLDTEHKLFCSCPTAMQEKEPISILIRRLHPVASELGHMDVAAQFEHLRNRTFHYQVFRKENCFVDTDEEPPHELNREALRVALEIALMLNCDIPSEVNVMRKTVTDGSNTGAFQRTMIVGLNGWMKYGDKKIKINQVCLEEDAAAIAGDEEKAEGKATYRLNRLGVPLVEITTGILEGFSPEQVQDIAFMIGTTCRSTGKMKRGIGTIRQDVNVSINDGMRVEVKGVQELGLLAKVVEKEAARQLELSSEGKKIEKETRAANPDGTTRFMRPMPGAARMYPETDVPPVPLEDKWLKEIEKSLPEPLTDKLEKFKSKLGLSNDLAVQIIGSEHLPLFEKIMSEHPKLNASVAVSTFTSTLKDLSRKGIDVSKLEDSHFLSIFSELAKGSIAKEAIADLLAEFVSNPGEPIDAAMKKLNLTMLGEDEIIKIIKEVSATGPNMPEGRLYGIVMGRVRGKADPQHVQRLVSSFKKK